MNDLEQALKVIREECKKHKNCPTCPLRNEEDGCYIHENMPNEWALKSDVKYDLSRVFV